MSHVKCGTFSNEPISDVVRERMRADRATTERDVSRDKLSSLATAFITSLNNRCSCGGAGPAGTDMEDVMAISTTESLVHGAWHEAWRTKPGPDNLSARVDAWNRSAVRGAMVEARDVAPAEYGEAGKAMIRKVATVQAMRETCAITCPACLGEPPPCVDGWEESPDECPVCGTDGVIRVDDLPRIIEELVDRIETMRRTAEGRRKRIRELLDKIGQMEGTKK